MNVHVAIENEETVHQNIQSDFIHSDKRPAVVSRRSFSLSAHLSLSLSVSRRGTQGYAGCSLPTPPRNYYIDLLSAQTDR